MPFGIKTHDEAGIPRIAGQAESAPANFNPKKIALRATILAALLCGAFVANYVNGWITVDDVNIYGKPPETGSSD
jgi:predicted secreted protein